MRAAYITEFCDPSGIHYGDLPDPQPTAGHVVVRVEAVAVDRVDTFVRSGQWRTPVTFPLAIGRDLVGTVHAVGAGVTHVAVGDHVWTNSAGYAGRPGATAELALVESQRLYPMPEDAPAVEFVASLHAGATAHGILLGRARLQAGETVVVVGANGAVGQCLVQIAARAGASVVATVRRESAVEPLKALGATHTVVTEVADALRTARDAAGADIDVLVDTTGRLDYREITELLAPRGRAVPMAGTGRRIDLDQWRFYTRELQLLGFIMSAMTVDELAAAAHWLTVSPLCVAVGAVLPFAEAARAHELVERGEVPHTADGLAGRLVLRP